MLSILTCLVRAMVNQLTVLCRRHPMSAHGVEVRKRISATQIFFLLFNFHTLKCRLYSSKCRLYSSTCGLYTSNSRLCTVHLKTVDYTIIYNSKGELYTPKCRLYTSKYGVYISKYSLYQWRIQRVHCRGSVTKPARSAAGGGCGRGYPPLAGGGPGASPGNFFRKMDANGAFWVHFLPIACWFPPPPPNFLCNFCLQSSDTYGGTEGTRKIFFYCVRTQ